MSVTRLHFNWRCLFGLIQLYHRLPTHIVDSPSARLCKRDSQPERRCVVFHWDPEWKKAFRDCAQLCPQDQVSETDAGRVPVSQFTNGSLRSLPVQVLPSWCAVASVGFASNILIIFEWLFLRLCLSFSRSESVPPVSPTRILQVSTGTIRTPHICRLFLVPRHRTGKGNRARVKESRGGETSIVDMHARD